MPTLPDITPGGPALDYASGNLTSGSVSVTGFVKSVRLFANGADSTATLGGSIIPLSGETINIRSGTGVDLNLFYRVQNLTITWGSGNIDYLVVYLPT